MNLFRRTLWLYGLLAVLAAPLATADPAHSPLLPDPAMTPGDVLTTDANVICVPGYTKTVRDVPQSVKNQVYRQCVTRCYISDCYAKGYRHNRMFLHS